ncbi:hypothetical protein OTSKARP_0730 [Orientia tsutsugamushi str. Karp]|nr:hypothetical protein OTSKARP_0730 [Orientia tsutsugamushi str. Karp]
MYRVPSVEKIIATFLCSCNCFFRKLFLSPNLIQILSTLLFAYSILVVTKYGNDLI